jgi:deoxycytidine triphosphate deaminase
MSVVDLTKRVTRDQSHYDAFACSADSLIRVVTKGELRLNNSEPATIDLTIGDSWYHSREHVTYEISPEGLTLRPGRSAVVFTEESLEVPHNVFGLLTGKGELIFKGVFISTGKIDPGFRNQLRIGVFNNGPEPITLKRGDVFCSCCFFMMESHLRGNPRDTAPKPSAKPHVEKRRTRVRHFLKALWQPPHLQQTLIALGTIASFAVALAALLLVLFGKK